MVRNSQDGQSSIWKEMGGISLGNSDDPSLTRALFYNHKENRLRAVHEMPDDERRFNIKEYPTKEEFMRAKIITEKFSKEQQENLEEILEATMDLERVRLFCYLANFYPRLESLPWALDRKEKRPYLFYELDLNKKEDKEIIDAITHFGTIYVRQFGLRRDISPALRFGDYVYTASYDNQNKLRIMRCNMSDFSQFPKFEFPT